jgi:heat shock protein HslJ
MKPLIKTKKLPFLPVLAGLMVLVPVLIVAGCTGNAPAPAGPALEETQWVLTGYLANDTFLQPLDSTTVTLQFGKDGSITGSAGCNHYFAPYEMKGTAVTIGPAGSTLMYCSGPGVMEQESAYLTLLGRTASITTGNDTLIFADATGTTILSFARMVPPAPEPLVGTNWTLDSIHTGDAVSSVIAGTTITAVFDEDGRVAGSAGCNRYFASYNVTGSSVAIGPVGSTKMYCNGPGVMQQESMYLASLGKTKTFAITGGRLSLADANGTTLLSFTRTA